MSPRNDDILAFRRMVAAGVVARLGLGMMFFAGLGMLMFQVGNRVAAAGMVALAGLAFFGLSWWSIRMARETGSAGEQLASGDLAGAEQVLVASLRRFSIFPRQRVVELYHLAMLRQEQGRLTEAAELAGAVLSTGRNGDLVDVGAMLVRVEALLELGELRGAYEILERMWNRPLEPIDQARLLVSRTRYEAMTGAYGQMLWGLSDKLRLTEMMPPTAYALIHGYWAVAARRAGYEELGRWLTCRAVTMSAEDEGKELKRRVPELADWIGEEVVGFGSSESSDKSAVGS